MIQILTRPQCPACNATKRWLDQHGLTYSEHQLDAETIEWARSQGHKQAPIVVFGETSFGGYSPTDLEALEAAIKKG
ncbi:glutaredoxin family protein [Corynebacterium auriscanis]|uniref:glutaredoxin family protein n=1 Tax=Corynebacterium auriscanis TaxID=99807 RepID=UPI003CE84096